MNPDKSPFDILGISPAAELEVVNAAYKAMARKYHPDMNPGVPPDELTRRMAELNWAKDELERDLEGWRKRANRGTAAKNTRGRSRSARSARRQTPFAPDKPKGVVVTEPQVLAVAGRRGSRTTFTATADGCRSSAIRARFKPGGIEVQRLSPAGDGAVFAVTVTEDFPSDVPDNAIETIDVTAPGFTASRVFVSIAPVSWSVLSQQYSGRIAPPRHPSHKARISFGKHRGRRFNEIAVEEPGYLEWMLREGAGSNIERQCAQMALAQVHAASSLPGKRGTTRRKLPRREPLAPSRTLPDPNRPGGLWQALRALFSHKERD